MARHRSEHGRADLRPMSRLVALRGYMQRDRLGGAAAYPERRGSLRTRAKRGNERPAAVRRGSPPSGRCRRGSQELPYYAGQPIPWSNSSWADRRRVPRQ